MKLFVPAVFLLSATMAAQHHLFTFHGTRAGDSFGRAVSHCGDWNKDGVPDIACGASIFGQKNSFALRVMSGADGRLIKAMKGGDYFAYYIKTGDVDGDKRVDLLIPNGKWFGWIAPGGVLTSWRVNVDNADTLAFAGDVNKDGRNDVICRSITSPGPNVFVYDVAKNQELAAFTPPKGSAGFGVGLAGLGDINGDGHSDFAIGAYGTATVAGFVNVYSGKTNKTLYQLKGKANEDFGLVLTPLGDLDGDKVADLAVGAPRAGYVRVVSGKAGKTLRTIRSPLLGIAGFGAAIAAADLDKDGVPDILIGAPAASLPNRKGCGAVMTFSGKTGRPLHTFFGDSAGDNLGFSVSRGTDINGDGHEDIIAGAPGDDDAGKDAGSVRVFSGAPLLQTADQHEIDVTKGGDLTTSIDGGVINAGRYWLVAGTMSGTKPGVRLGAWTVPINVDAYTSLSLAIRGQLDQNGRATLATKIPPGLLRFRNTVMHHAVIVYDATGAILDVSTAVPLRFL